MTENLMQYGTSMFSPPPPPSFSDHKAVVLQFIGMGMGGRQPLPDVSP